MQLRPGRVVALLVVLSLVGWLVAGASASLLLVSSNGPRGEEARPTWAREGQFEAVRLQTRDGEEIGAWFVPARDARGVVLLLHGNGSRRTLLNRHAITLTKHGFHAMSFSLRAHGDSTGSRNDFGWSAKADLLAAVDFAEERAPGLPIAIIGTSLGAAAAIFAAPELGERVRGYWLNAPYRDLQSAAWDRCARVFPPVLDYLAYAGLQLWTPLWLEVDIDRVRPVDFVGRFHSRTQVLFTVGELDASSPPEDVSELVERCSGQARRLVFEGVGHEGLEMRDFERYMQLVLEFLDDVME